MSSTAAQNKFERIANAVGISDAGKAFLIAAVDPFHDEPISGLRGIPDGTNSNSVVQIVRSSTTVRAPAAVTTGTWDCHVQSLPITQDCEQTAGVTPYRTDTLQDLGTFIPLPGANQNVGSITINSGPTTVPAPNLGIFGGGGTGQESSTINPSFNYTGGTFRVIAKGYEVISSGPQLYKSGVVFTYGLPVANSDITENMLVMGKDETGTLSATARNVMRLPDTPLNTRDCTIIPGSQSWPAKDGVYMVDRFNDPDVSTFSSKGVVGYCLSGTQGGAPTSPAGMASYRSWLLANVNVTNANFGNLNADFVKCPTAQNGADIQKMNLSGAYFTGLNPQDVLVVNVVWYIERFPDDSNRDLLVLAKPTPHYEPNVMDMYSVIMGEMPWGMVQKANGFGDFFKDVVDVVSNTVAPALAALPGSAGMVGKVGTIGGKLLGGLLGGSGASKNSEKVNAPSVYSENGKQKIFLEEVHPRVRELKNQQPKKKKKSVTSLLKKVSLGTKKTKKKKNR